ncbi:MAG: hypothetical protein KMY55_01375 [Dethiosulfatibacter sp.]|nr:hypothetical protein [Dethiosulfatibacter sp.]
MRIEKKKKSKMILVAMIVALIMLMTGCIQMEVGIELNQDGTGKLEVLMAQNTDLTDEELDTEMGALTIFNEGDFEGLEGVSVRTEVVEYMDKGYNFAGEKAIIEIEDMLSFLAEMEQTEDGDDLRLIDLPNGNLRLEMDITPEELASEDQESTENDAELYAMMEAMGLKMHYSITTDYTVVNHNAHLVEGNKYIIDLLRLSRELENTGQERIVFFVEFEAENSIDEPMEEPEEETYRTSENREFMENMLQIDLKFDRSSNDFYGEALREIGILKGTDNGLELDKGLTRAEGAVMYSRLLGLEDEVNVFATENPDYQTNFTDVPDWVKPTINYLHKLGYVNGISSTEYGSGNLMKETEYATLVLRALGFKDGVDFEWNTANIRAKELGLYAGDSVSPSEILGGEFNRRKMSYISYNALFFQDAEGVELIERLRK